MRQDDTLIAIPVSDEARRREEALGNRLRTYQKDSTIIRPGQRVDLLYQLLEGSVDVVRDLGTSKESRQSFRRVEPNPRDQKGWTPLLGGRYLFTGRPSRMHYIARSACTFAEITPDSIRGLYYNKDCVKLIREFVRNSDLPLEMIHEELDKRFDIFRFAGFRKEDLDGLLLIEDRHLTGGDETRAESRMIVRKEFVAFACDMVFRLMGDRLKTRGDVTEINFVPSEPPLGR